MVHQHRHRPQRQLQLTAVLHPGSKPTATDCRAAAGLKTTATDCRAAAGLELVAVQCPVRSMLGRLIASNEYRRYTFLD